MLLQLLSGENSRDQVLQAQKQREVAMAAYYIIKAEKIKLEIEHIKKTYGV